MAVEYGKSTVRNGSFYGDNVPFTGNLQRVYAGFRQGLGWYLKGNKTGLHRLYGGNGYNPPSTTLRQGYGSQAYTA